MDIAGGIITQRRHCGNRWLTVCLMFSVVCATTVLFFVRMFCRDCVRVEGERGVSKVEILLNNTDLGVG